MAQYPKEEIRKKILKSAREEFYLNGYQNASMRKIAQNASMTVGNLYSYFKGKDEMLLYFVEPIIETVREKIKEIVLPVFTSNASNSFSPFFASKIMDKNIEIAIERFADFFAPYCHEHQAEFLLLVSNIDQIAPKTNNNMSFSSIYNIVISRIQLKKGKETLSQEDELFALMQTRSFLSCINTLLREKAEVELIHELFIKVCKMFLQSI